MEPQKSRIRPVESSQSLSSVGNLIECSAPRACNVDLPYWMQKNWWRGVWKYPYTISILKAPGSLPLNTAEIKCELRKLLNRKCWFFLFPCRRFENTRKRLLQQHQREQYKTAIKAAVNNPKYIADPDDSGMPEKTSTPSIDALFRLSFERMLRSAGCVVCNANVATNLMYGYTIHLNAQVSLQAFIDLLEQSTWRRTIGMWKSFPTRTTIRIWFENKHY